MKYEYESYTHILITDENEDEDNLLGEEWMYEEDINTGLYK